MPWTEITRLHYERRCVRFASDLTDTEWALIEAAMPSANRIGLPRKTVLREVVNALLYLASSGGHGDCCRKTEVARENWTFAISGISA